MSSALILLDAGRVDEQEGSTAEVPGGFLKVQAVVYVGRSAVVGPCMRG